jgi:outer membrane protein OmpA-like peptidoglycan-associated protein
MSIRVLKVIGSAVTLLALSASSLPAQEDQGGGKDHALFTRMPGYFIENYKHSEFDAFKFEDANGKPVTVEGRFTLINYSPKEQLKKDKQVPSPLAIGRNYQNAALKLGGEVLFQQLASGGGLTTMKLTKDGQEVWVKVGIGDSGYNYHVAIVERAAMEQQVTGNADAWRSDIGTTGHVAVYGIYFDTDKAMLKPESEPALAEIAKLLQADPKLNLRVVGHTDATGEYSHNMSLSEARAKAVVSALTSGHGIAAARLTAHGVGPLAPVASNDTEEGRAKNRRVELVKN